MAELGEGLSGYLDVQDATLRAPRLEAVSNIGIANTAPQHAFSVGSNLYVDTESSNVLTVKGNVVTEGIKMGFIEITPSYDFAAVSNVGNTTSNIIQFANATTGFVTTANVEIGGNITLTANAQVKVGSNVLAEYTGPHGRDPTTPLLKKYPEIAFDASKLDGNDTTNTYVQAGYTVTASSSQYANLGFYPWKVFDGNITATNTYHGWHSGGNPSTVSGSPYNTIDSSYVGEWIKLELPKAIKLDHFTIAPRDGYAFRQAPKDFKVYGSNDDSTWVELVEVTNATVYIDKQFNTTNVTTSDYYKYFALVIQDRVISGGAVAISGWELYGYEEPAPPGDLSLDTTLKSTFNSVRSNNYVMYFDGEDPTGDPVVPKYLPSGTVKTITPNNITFDATNNCWSLDGSTESNVTTADLGFEGDAPHTVSTWINASNLEANATTQQLFSIGSGYSEEIVRVDDTQIAANTWHNVTYAYQGEGGSKVTYVDGRKVAEAQVEDTFGDYPPFDMTDYEVGGYRVSVSSAYIESTYRPFSAFNDGGTDINNVWHSPPSYTGTSSEYVGDVRLAANVDPGHWIKLETPHKLQVSYVNLVARPPSGAINLETQAPKDFQVCGSNDDVNWDVLASFTGEAPQDDGTSNYNVNAQRGYKYLALAVNKAVNSTSVTIANIKFYGHKEGDLTRFPEPTKVLKYPHIAMTGPGQRGYVATASSILDSTRQPWEAFNGLYGDDVDGWFSQSGYGGADNAYSGSANLGSDSGGPAFANEDKGEWLKLEMPHKLTMTHIKIYASGSTRTVHAPEDFKMWGSNDNTNWTEILSETGAAPTVTGSTYNADTTTTAYKYFALVTTKLVNTNSHCDIGELEIYGTEEDTGTPAIVGGPFAGKVANFRVYDQYLGDERIQEIYDAQKDEFGHKKSSMTFYKGRVGVGTTEPEGALTVLDEPHALAKFPARAVFSNDSYVEGDGQIKLSAVEGSGYQAFDGLTSTSWTATPTRNTRLSEEVDFGAWLKLQTPESISLKKAEIESNPYWRQVGSTINDSAEHAANSSSFGNALDCTDDGTRIIVGAFKADEGGSDRGQAFVFDWNGSGWVRVGNIFQGTQDGEQLGYAVAISGDGNYVAVGSNLYDNGSTADVGRYGVFYLSGSTWTIVPDSGALTSTAANEIDYFVGAATNDRAGWSLSLSHDGKTIAAGYRQLVVGSFTQAGQIRVHTYANGAWTQKGQNLNGEEISDRLGESIKITPDGNHLIAGAKYGSVSAVYVYDYNSFTLQWVKRTTLNHPTLPNANTHFYGSGIAISDDGNTVAVGASGDDGSGTDWGRVYVYTWSGTAWTLVSTLVSPLQGTNGELFGTAVDLSGDGTRLVAAAAYENSEQGYAFTYEYTGGTWQLRNYATIGSAGVSDDGRLGEYYTGLIISRDGSTIVGGDRAGGEGKVRVWNMPSNIKSIWGSNDDVNWTKITTGNETFRVTDRLEFKNLDNPNYYKYHAIVGDAFTRLKDVKLYGIRNQGSSTLHDGALTLTKKVTAPQLESTGIVNMKGDYTEIRANSNVVTEFNRSKKLIKYPRVALTSAAETGGYQGYIVTRSSQFSSYNAWEAFDENNPVGTGQEGAGSGWASTIPGTYSVSTGAETGSVEHHTGSVQGEWIQIQLPESIYLHDFVIESRSETTYNTSGFDQGFPEKVVLYGSNDGSSWVSIKTFTTVDKNHSKAHTENINETTQTYKYFALVVNSIHVFQNTTQVSHVSIGQIRLFGTPEYDPEARGTDVVVKSVPNVPNTDWLEVYYEGKNYSGFGAVQDETSNDIDATIGAATTFDSVNKAWSFSGASNRDGTEFVSGYLPSDFEGNQIHSVSMWLKFDYWHEGAFCIIGKATRTNNDNHKAIHFQFQDTGSARPRILYDFWSNQKSFYLPDDVQPGKWLHMTATYTGNAAIRKMFVNGQELTTFTTNSSYATELALDTTNDLVVRLGSRYPVNSTYSFHGDIANFRLFNRALTTDEIWQLYAYQKEYFGHGDLGMTLKAGRLGIGTSEPRAMLDVQGIPHGPNSRPCWTLRATSVNSDNFAVWDQSDVDNFNGATGDTDYIIPVSGYYFMQAILIVSASGGRANLRFYKNGTGIGALFLQDPITTAIDAGRPWNQLTGIITYYFKQGDVVKVYLDGSTYSSYNCFTGFHLGF